MNRTGIGEMLARLPLSRPMSDADWPNRHPRMADLCAVGATGVAIAVRAAVDHLIPPGFPFLTFFPAVVLSTALLGLRPGIICATLSGLAAWYFFFPPFESFTLNGPVVTALGFYAAVVAVDIGLIHGLRRTATRLSQSRSAVERLSETLELQVATRTAELRKAATLQTAILANAGYAIIATDARGTITLFNPAAERMLGYAAADVIGQADPSVFHDPEEMATWAERQSAELGRPFAPGFDALIANVPESGAVPREWTFRTRHGVRFPALLTVSRLKADDGGLIGFLKIVVDLTQQHRHEAELKAAGAGAWKVDVGTGRVWCSAETARQHDLPEQPIELDIGREWARLVHPDDGSRAIADLEAAIAAKGTLSTEFRVWCRDGRVRWIAALGEVETNEHGVPVRVMGLSLDITGRKEAELALRDSEQRYRMLAENTVDMVVQTDMNAVRRYVSPGCRKILGYEPEELLGRRPHEIIHPDDLPIVDLVIKDLASLRRMQAVQRQRYRRKDGSYVWVEVTYRIMVDPEGRPVGCMACTRDISEQQAHAEALQQATLAAERASRAKTDFLAAMSHEIRTPLNAIIGFTDLMVGSGRLDPQMRRHAELVRVSGAALLTVVNDILDFSKVEAGALELVREPFALRTLIGSCVEIIRSLAAPKGLELHVDIDDLLPDALLGDGGRLRQILLNLLNNAVKFTSSGSVTLAARRDEPDPDGLRLRFTVADTGIGIAAEKQARLFERFWQVDGSIQRHYGGTGLGLAICKRLVELMGGEIGVFSEGGRGSTFWFTIVLPHAPAPAIAAPQVSPPVRSRRGRLLLAEDVEINQELVKTVLEAAGHQVDVVGDGAAAVAAVEAVAYDLVLMDVQMPGMDGLTATRLIRELPTSAATIPIIALTANVLPDEIRSFQDVGMNGHLGKPFDYADLCAAVDTWLGDEMPA